MNFDSAAMSPSAGLVNPDGSSASQNDAARALPMRAANATCDGSHVSSVAERTLEMCVPSERWTPFVFFHCFFILFFSSKDEKKSQLDFFKKRKKNEGKKEKNNNTHRFLSSFSLSPEQLRQTNTPRLTEAHVGPLPPHSAHRRLASSLRRAARARRWASAWARVTEDLSAIFLFSLVFRRGRGRGRGRKQERKKNRWSRRRRRQQRQSNEKKQKTRPFLSCFLSFFLRPSARG